jgi:hypothetical protein
MRWYVIFLVAFSFSIGTARAGDVADNPFFKAIAGSWSGDGELVSADGEPTSIHEEWTAARLDNGSFEVKGTRKMGEEDQEYRWVYTLNAATELVECEYRHTGMEEALRFQVQISENEVRLSTPFGGEGSELVIENSLSGKTIKGKISVQNASGEKNLSGEVIHKRKE